ncbi:MULTISPECIES: sensor domain-containing protein [unclassified Mycobacterium]|uniref:sensor domain-containing protein n=1 Tax=unclassified Mycobacterium TaxID=2642494 RepID=UPI0029C973E0|nr:MULTISPECIES: sensor domain-containing protein [unclassified Mycobacterium]
MSKVRSPSRPCAVALVVAASVLLSGCANVVSGSAIRDEHVVPLSVPPLDASQFDDLLLGVDELNDIVGSSTMELDIDATDMTDNSDTVSDPDCLGTVFGAEEQVYGDEWTAVRDQVVREPGDDKEHWAEQTIVTFPSEQQAQKFYVESTTAWEQCGGFSVTVDNDEFTYIWQLDQAAVEGDYLTQNGTQEESDGWECQHALAAISNAVVETWACAYGVGDEALEMARRIVANAAAA